MGVALGCTYVSVWLCAKWCTNKNEATRGLKTEVRRFVIDNEQQEFGLEMEAVSEILKCGGEESTAFTGAREDISQEDLIVDVESEHDENEKISEYDDDA